MKVVHITGRTHCPQMKLTEKDIDRIFGLTGEALSGILADHCHVRQIQGLSCGQSVAEWASTLGIETFFRLRKKLGECASLPENPPLKSIPHRMTKKTRLYPRQPGL